MIIIIWPGLVYTQINFIRKYSANSMYSVATYFGAEWW